MSREEIKEYLILHMEQQLNVRIPDDENIFQLKYKVEPRDFLSILLGLESKIGKRMTDIFKTNDSSIMTVNHLSDLIYKCGNDWLEKID